MDPAKLVLRFLRSVAPTADAEFYLRLFLSRPRESFATIAVEANAVEAHADAVAFDLRILHEFGLTPVVVLGLHAPQDASERVRKLHRLLAAAGVDARTLAAGDATDIVRACRAGAVPLVALTEPDDDARLATLGRLVGELGTRRLVWLRTQGGLRPRGEQRLGIVNLSTEHAGLRAEGGLDINDQRTLDDTRKLIFELVPHRLTVSLTSPLNLLHELFSVKGAGTLLRQGAVIERHDGWEGVDRDRLAALLQAAFGQPAAATFFERALAQSLIEEEYRGAALVTHTPLASYLTKFAVDREAQGEGIGQDLWSELQASHPRLVWRARPNNPVRGWYERCCHGRVEVGAWTVYFRGIATATIPEAVELALGQPVDF